MMTTTRRQVLGAALAGLTAKGQTPSLSLFDFEARRPDLQAFVLDRLGASSSDGALRLTATEKNYFPSAVLPAPQGHWDLDRFGSLSFEVRNPGPRAVTVMCWAFVPGGWGGISSYPLHENGREVLKPGERRVIRIDLHQRYPGGMSRAIDPSDVTYVRIVPFQLAPGDSVDLLSVRAEGVRPSGIQDAPGRLRVPAIVSGVPAPGKRVRIKPASWSGSGPEFVLYLPPEWKKGGRYAVIIEYPGNEFFWKNCHSTGYTEQGNIGYGMSRGSGFLWLNLPFVTADRQHEQTGGWGDADATVEYAWKAIREVCLNYGGDPASVIFTGFSRGGIACGYIGLRNDDIAKSWLAFHALQGADGQNWNGADRATALVRAKRMRGRSTLITDTPHWQDVLKETGNPVRVLNSGIGAHVDTGVLEDRPATVECRDWLQEVLRTRPGTHRIAGRVTDASGRPLRDVLVETGLTHFTYSGADDGYVLGGLIDGSHALRFSREGHRFEAMDVEVSGADLRGLDVRGRRNA